MSSSDTPARWLLGAYWNKRRLRTDDFVGVAIATMEALQAGHPAVGAWYEADDGPVPRLPPLELTEAGLVPDREPGFDVRIHAWNGDIDAVVLYSAMASDYGAERVPQLVKVEMPGPSMPGWDDEVMEDLLFRMVELTPADDAVLTSREERTHPLRRRAMVGWRTYVRDTPGGIDGLPVGVSSRAMKDGCLISFDQPASEPIDPGAMQQVADRLDAIWDPKA